MDVTYSPNPGSVRKFLEHVQSAGVPSKVTGAYLKSVGFKSSNDRYLIGILKAFGFIDGSGIPTDTWKRYRNKKDGPKVLAAALRAAYSDLFETYPDAYRKDNEALRNFFTTHTTVGELTLNYVVRTFKTLADLADFEGSTPMPAPPSAATPVESKGTVSLRPTTGVAPEGGITVNLNLQITVAATDDVAVYDRFFAALKKHLYPDR